MRPIDISPDMYIKQLQDKQAFLIDTFTNTVDVPIEIFESQPLHYRMRAEFRVWHEGEDLFHVMFDTQTKQKYRVDHFPPASLLINAVMKELIEKVKTRSVLRQKLFQIDYLSTTSNQIVVTLTYHRPLDDTWITEAKSLKLDMSERFNIDFIGRARKQKLLVDRDFVIESIPVNGHNYIFKQVENSFTQPNAGINSQMIEWALDVTTQANGDLLELYCGAGNFSLPLAQNFERVLATEIAKPSVEAAQYNLQVNDIKNVNILRMSSEEFVEAQQGKRIFKRLQGIELSHYNIQTVLVDPPRAGLDEKTLNMVSAYQNIVYISCNPQTLNRDLTILSRSHRVTRFAMFDQFPYTEHAECGVYLVRNH